MTHSKQTSEILQAAKDLRAQGLADKEIATALGLTATTVRCWLDPLYAKRRREMVNDARNRRAKKPATRWSARAQPPVNQIVPPDTRNTTARLCGDPLPGRSALDQRGKT